MAAMSVSSACSQSTVGFQGQMVNLESALQNVFDDMMSHMTKIQFVMKQLAMAVEQDLPFSAELELSALIMNETREMGWLHDDLHGMQEDLISLPDTAEDKALYKKWKIDQKLLHKTVLAAHAEKFKADRAASKLAFKLEKQSLEDSEMKE